LACHSHAESAISVRAAWLSSRPPHDHRLSRPEDLARTPAAAAIHWEQRIFLEKPFACWKVKSEELESLFVEIREVDRNSVTFHHSSHAG
jgi:hypothetical protein